MAASNNQQPAPVTLHIKNMVCPRCVFAVRNVLEEQGLHPHTVELGRAELAENALTGDQLENTRQALQTLGFELITDRRNRIVEGIKTAVIDLIHYSEAQPSLRHSDYIAGQLHHDYHYLSKLFSETEGLTIEQYIIHQKIEKVKELLTYDELSLSEIADRLGYSSVAHLSAQFRKVTGMTASAFRAGNGSRKGLDAV